jgi:NAD(P)-dependent dehydrogenase (short-subunit alcohol dehydrogenase family)
MKKVIVVTGASSGFGALAARALAKAAHVVYASMRDTSGRNKGQVQEAAKFAADNKADLRTVELDVLSDTSVKDAVKKIIDDNGRWDAVVHNAGHMVFGPLEAFTTGEAAKSTRAQ